MLNKEINHVICPYCCHKFKPYDAEFRLSASVAIKKDEKKAQRKTDLIKDEKLFHYYANILDMDTKEATQLSMQFMAVSMDDENITYDENEVKKFGFAQNIIYTTQEDLIIMADKRLCPFCHNELPVGYGLRETILISVLGDAHVGKSVYITMLIDELENNKDFVSKLSFIGNQHSKEIIYECYQKPLLKEHKLLESTKRNKVPPFSYNYWYQYKDENGDINENTIDIIFYDIAGEDLHDASDMKKNGFNIKNSSGIIFILDPTNFKNLEDLFRLEDNKLIASIPENNSVRNIFSAMFNYFLGMNTEKSDIPLALVISKTDLFQYIDMSFFSSRPESRIQRMLDNEGSKGYFDIKNSRALNCEIRELLEYLDEDPIVNYGLGSFKNVQCFSVSSLGKKPIEKTGDLYFTDGDIKPFRVKEPLYWILNKNGLLAEHETPDLPRIQKPKSIFGIFITTIKNFFSF